MKILFVRLSPSSFVQNDLNILKKHYNVKEVDFILTRTQPKDTIKSICGLFTGILWADLTFSWFADYHAYWAIKLSKIFKKKSIVVVGGYEVANVPEMDYGLMNKHESKDYVTYILDNADKILAVSEFTKNEITNYTDSTNIKIVYNGVNCHKFKSWSKKENMVVTVGNTEEKTFKLKGIDTFIKVASHFPEIKFVIIGNYDLKFQDRLDVSQNIIFTGPLPHEDLISWLGKSKVYCQLSYRESFGMALAESMCCECIPIVTYSTALPEVVGNTGFYVHYGDIGAILESIKKALSCNEGKNARKRIMEMFPIHKREKILKKIIDNLA